MDSKARGSYTKTASTSLTRSENSRAEKNNTKLEWDKLHPAAAEPNTGTIILKVMKALLHVKHYQKRH